MKLLRRQRTTLRTTRLRTTWLLAGAALGASTLTPARADFFFRDGDVPIVLLGDSITQQRMYTTFMETFVLTRFPQWNVQMRNIGWGGDTAWLRQRGGFESGLKRDVMSLQPKAITIDFGMNDARGGDGTYQQYIEHSTKLAQQLKAAGARVALVTPSPEEKFDATQPGGSGYNNMLWKYSLGLKEVAQKEGVLFVDQYTPFIKVIEEGRKAGVLTSDGKDGKQRLIPDAVHPNWAGHLVMAASILKGLDAPSLVSRVEYDAATGQSKTQNCQVTGTVTGAPADKAAAGEIRFTRTDNALPWPIPPDAQFVLKVPGFAALDGLNRYELQVGNAPSAKYDLLIDDQKAGTFTKEELARGVNVALQAGPITEQAMKIHQAVLDKNNLFFNRWRNVQIFAAPSWIPTEAVESARKAEIARLDAQIADREKQINALRQPKPHVWRLVPAT